MTLARALAVAAHLTDHRQAEVEVAHSALTDHLDRAFRRGVNAPAAVYSAHRMTSLYLNVGVTA